MISSPNPYPRRRFLRQLIGAASIAGAQTLPIFGDAPAPAPQAFRFAFLTDLHFMNDGALGSAQGIAACLRAVEKLSPRPEFILVGGDLVHLTRESTIAQGERSYDLFLKVWSDNTALPTHWVFGNHDLAGTSNASVQPTEKEFGKALFQDRLGVRDLCSSFDWRGWHFIILDDIQLQADRTYRGDLRDDELAFLRADLEANQGKPTIVSTHVPLMSNLPAGMALQQLLGKASLPIPKVMVCDNGDAALQCIAGHAVQAVLCGHLHFYENIQQDGRQLINSGAVCGNYWKGPMYGCPAGFGVVDVDAGGKVAFRYRPLSAV